MVYRVRRRLGRTDLREISSDQEIELMVGPRSWVVHGSYFASDADRRAAWAQHGDRLMDLAGFPRRTFGFWFYGPPASNR